MNVIIAGAGEVGGHAAEVLSGAGHSVTVIDHSIERLRHLDDTLDVRTLAGHCAHLDVLRAAGAEKCDLILAATQIDEVNLLTASFAKAVGTKKTIVRVHHTANVSLQGSPFAESLGIDQLICPEQLTALTIARTLRNPGSIALEEFGRGKLLMQRFIVVEDAPASGKVLAELTLPPSTRLATVDNEQGYTLAGAKTVVSAGDFVTLVGEANAFDQARMLFTTEKIGRQHVAVMGETPTAVWLCRALKTRYFAVRLFVDAHDRAEELAEKLGHITVIEADPTDSSTFAEEHLEKVDSFIAVTDDDERNILACAQAKAMGVATTTAVVQRAKYLHLFPHVGIDHAFSPRAVAVAAIQHLIDTGTVRVLAHFADGMAAVYEVRPIKRAKILGHELRNIRMPAHSMIAAIRRGEDVQVPGADDQVELGDVILVIGPCDVDDDLRKLFGAK